MLCLLPLLFLPLLMFGFLIPFTPSYDHPTRVVYITEARPHPEARSTPHPAAPASEASR